MTLTSSRRPAPVSRHGGPARALRDLGRTATPRGPVRQALVEALIGAVLEELGGVGAARATPGTAKTEVDPLNWTADQRR